MRIRIRGIRIWERKGIVFMQFQVQKSYETKSQATSSANRQHNDIYDVIPRTDIESDSPFVRM